MRKIKKSYLGGKLSGDLVIKEEDFDWLIGQAEKLTKLEESFMKEDYRVIDYLKTSSEVFEDKLPPTRIRRL